MKVASEQTHYQNVLEAYRVARTMDWTPAELDMLEQDLVKARTALELAWLERLADAGSD